MNKDIVKAPMTRIVRGDEVKGQGIVVEIERMRNNIRLTFTNGTTLMRGKKVESEVVRDLKFYRRSQDLFDLHAFEISKLPAAHKSPNTRGRR